MRNFQFFSWIGASEVVSVPLTVDSSSSVFRNDNGNWGPEQALTPVSDSWIGYWHSDVDDDFPWIKFNMPPGCFGYKVVSVEVTDRQDCCEDRFQDVDVVVVSGLNGEVSCGRQSYSGSRTYK